MGPEWRAFDHEQRDKRTRVGAPITYTIHDKGLSTMIDWRNKDIYGRDIPARNRAQWYRLRKWQRKIRISGATERNLAFALSELDRDSSRLGLPRSVREAASVVYRSAVDNKLIRGRSIEGVVAASLYAACRRCNVPRTLDEIAEVSRVSKKEVGRTYRFLTRELNIKLPPTSPVDYVPRFASELGLSGEAQSKAIEIIEKAMEKGLTSGRGSYSAITKQITNKFFKGIIKRITYNTFSKMLTYSMLGGMIGAGVLGVMDAAGANDWMADWFHQRTGF